MAEARLFTQQLHQQQLNQQQQHQSFDQQQPRQEHQQHLRRTSMTGSVSGGGRSLFGSILAAGRGTTSGASTVASGHVASGGIEEPSEQTLLLARPLWVQDQDASACRICARSFNAVRRKIGGESEKLAQTAIAVAAGILRWSACAIDN
ncbi:hypothetical protein BGZ94_007916 [Podila epigama]|nr:hypothetical protein BGZ94_007916 [Podila epigama]